MEKSLNKEYISMTLSVSKDKRLSGTWTLEQYEGQYRAAMYAAVKSEFPIVKDTTPNMMNPRLYTTSYNKPQGQQFDDTAVLSFIKLQYT